MQQVLDVHVEHDIHHPNNCHNRPVLPISNFIQIITSKPTKGAYPRSETRVPYKNDGDSSMTLHLTGLFVFPMSEV